jgi:hypothetical protein
MSRAEEFRRLMLHAAARLSEEDASVREALADAVNEAGTRLGRNQRMARLSSYVAASTYVQLVLEMVASFLVDDEDPNTEVDP